tara:strand:+ start:107 stop:268 length:162 start_codon:yes stop_codon:yes gene_type:complete
MLTDNVTIRAGAVLDDVALGQAEVVQRHQAAAAPFRGKNADRLGQAGQRKTCG